MHLQLFSRRQGPVHLLIDPQQHIEPLIGRGQRGGDQPVSPPQITRAERRAGQVDRTAQPRLCVLSHLFMNPQPPDSHGFLARAQQHWVAERDLSVEKQTSDDQPCPGPAEGPIDRQTGMAPLRSALA